MLNAELQLSNEDDSTLLLEEVLMKNNEEKPQKSQKQASEKKGEKKNIRKKNVSNKCYNCRQLAIVNVNPVLLSYKYVYFLLLHNYLGLIFNFRYHYCLL